MAMSHAASMYLRCLHQKQRVKGYALKQRLREEGFPVPSDRTIRRHTRLPLNEK